MHSYFSVKKDRGFSCASVLKISLLALSALFP